MAEGLEAGSHVPFWSHEEASSPPIQNVSTFHTHDMCIFMSIAIRSSRSVRESFRYFRERLANSNGSAENGNVQSRR